MIQVVFWDFGGVITTSPFEAFARYERERGLPADFVRTLNSTNPDTNAWAKLERSQVGFDEFCALYEAEAKELGYELEAREVIACLAGDVRPEMVAALRRIRENGLRNACLTNNFSPMGSGSGRRGPGDILSLFDVVVESSRTGVRKPDRRFYEMACELCEIEPSDVVFLDDLGVNLKPARAMGMHTIKVVDADQALGELEEVLGFAVR